MKNYLQNAIECCFSEDCGRTRDAHQHLVYRNLVSEQYSGSCKKGDDRAFYTTKCAAV
ncbi:hypothetical protein E2C01_078091 [Portunus trituberculatus]|uniref:Uncharacterized protein n=1 Tax=Portunus trituberculatus TaxID=210409 RepID=A0A5B7ID31_PORTR|nr:hypothetical protein [Portunus trituberculatus]